MKIKYFQEIKVPEGVEINLEDNILKVKGPEGEVKRKIDLFNLDFENKNKNIKIGNKKTSKKEKKRINTLIAHLKNMIHGVQKPFEYKVKICSSHFPMSIETSEKEVKIKNYYGEKVPRIVKIPSGVKISAERETITIVSIDKELAGMAAANFEHAIKIRKKDKRIFQDGAYIIKKPRREIEE
jgi:large subunit ribosomal protein L6